MQLQGLLNEMGKGLWKAVISLDEILLCIIYWKCLKYHFYVVKNCHGNTANVFVLSQDGLGVTTTHSEPLCPSLPSVSRVRTGRPTAAPHCPHACPWSRARAPRRACSPHSPTLTPPSARWRATWGPGSCVMSSWWQESAGYQHTGRTCSVFREISSGEKFDSLGLRF